MKKIVTIFLTTFILYPTLSESQEKKIKTEFKIWGNCEMCNEKITNTVKSINGVIYFKWDEKTKIAKIKYRPNLTSLETIQKKISLSGYDTENYKSPDKIYNNLHYCCKYDRN
tara:strand:- start:101037 stop:101375 length:339 start_codon:yes stop_codon:yes gene_type:complete